MSTTPLIDCRDQGRVAVAIQRGLDGYAPREQAPYHPAEDYPESPFLVTTPDGNPAYALVRQALADLGLDSEHYGTRSWNPIGSLVKPGGTILVKPNWVLHANDRKGGTDCLFTQAPVLRAVLDYVYLARPGQVIIGDAPVQGCDLDVLLDKGSREVVDFMLSRGLSARVVDFRRTRARHSGKFRWTMEEGLRLLGDYTTVDLGNQSLLEPISQDAEKFRVTMYDPRRMRDHHMPGRHQYLIAREVLESDLVINLPKLKTHKKAGLTCALKNLVGINGNKDYLPHHRKGSASWGGDNYARSSIFKTLAEEVLDVANKHISWGRFYQACTALTYALLVMDIKTGGIGDVEGSWYGNDTVWRMVLDLNRVLLYADAQGRMTDTPQRVELSITDGIVAGQGDGPLRPDPCPLGAVVAALNPAAADWVAALLLGLDPERVPVVARTFDAMPLPITRFSSADIACSVNGDAVPLCDVPRRFGVRAIPPRGWAGHCEWKQA